MAKLPPEKQRFLDEMKNFIEEEGKWLQEIVDYIEWNIEDLPKIADVRIYSTISLILVNQTINSCRLLAG